MTNEELKSLITAHTPDAAFEESQYLNVIVEAPLLHSLAKYLHDTPETSFDYLTCLSAVDWKDYFFTVYHLTSRTHRYTLVLKAKITDRENPLVDSVTDLWQTAEFHEREAFDLFGIKFNNHPDLRRLFLDDTWGFPLRKDYEDDITLVSL
jgi:NADH-quinone oxidoreductase subunit C